MNTRRAYTPNKAKFVQAMQLQNTAKCNTLK